MTVQIDRAQLLSLRDSQENRCFVCGPGNPMGLHLRFEEAEGLAAANFVPGQWHEGWQGAVHGGILASVLDEAMAYVLYFSGVQGITARLDIRFRRPAAWGEALRVEARMVRDGRKLADVEGRVLRDDELIAQAEGRYMKAGPVTPESMRRGQF